METHILIGAEDVRRAAATMRAAVQDFVHAVANLADEHRRHEDAMREILAEGHHCQLPSSIQEALNSGDGSYQP